MTDLDSKHQILHDNRRRPDGISIFRFNGRGKNRQGAGGGLPSNIELREDGGFELREDGGYELRE